jgi:Mrp family chromosome partitioning ATPase
LSLALAAVRAGVRTVVVDADIRRPELASRLGVMPQCGWEDVLSGKTQLNETLIESVEDGLTLLPLNDHGDTRSASISPDLDHHQAAHTLVGLAPILDDLRACFDLVLIDCGPLSSSDESAGPLSSEHRTLVDTTVLVEDVRLTSPSDIVLACGKLDTAGILCVGIVENFAA